MTETEAVSKPLSEFSRLSGVFFNPMQAFRDIAARPKWFVPAILIVVANLVLVFLISQHIGFDRIVQKSIDESPRAASMSAEQRDQAVQMGEKIGPVMGYAVPPVLIPASMLTVGVVLMMIVNAMFSTQVQFAQMVAIGAYAFLVQVVVIIMTTIVLFLKPPDDFDVRNPLAFNLGAFLPDATPKWLLSLATSMDLFTFWTIALLATGIVVVTRKRQWGKALFAVVAPWLLIVVLKAGWAALFG